MNEEDAKSMQNTKEWIDLFLSGGYYLGVGLGIWFVARVMFFTAPPTTRFILSAMRRKRPRFENCALAALAAITLPVLVAQLGLLLSGPVLPPIVGWRIYVYGSLTAGTAAVFLGAHALMHLAEPSGRQRATVATSAGVLVLVLLYTSTRIAPSVSSPSRRGLPRINDVTTSVDDPPIFVQLADANHTGGYPPRNVPLMREYYAELLRRKTSSLPIGAALIRSLQLAEELGWSVVTHIEMEEGHSVAPSVWMNATEVAFEATTTSHSPLFRVPDEVAVRVRTHTFDDGYVGSVVDVRSRGHLPDDRGVNVARIMEFLDHEY